MRSKFSSSTRCLARICFDSSRCCNTQPLHTPKWAQRGSTRSGEACSTSSVVASSKLRERAVWRTITRSPGSASATNTVLPPSRRATPRPSWLRSLISSSKGVWSIRATCRQLRAGRPHIVADAAASPGVGAPASRLLLLPGPALLVPPARARTRDPLAGEHVADLRFPFRMAVGHGDLAIHGLAIAVVVGHGGIDRDPVLDRQPGRIAHHHRAVAGETQRAG